MSSECAHSPSKGAQTSSVTCGCLTVTAGGHDSQPWSDSALVGDKSLGGSFQLGAFREVSVLWQFLSYKSTPPAV